MWLADHDVEDVDQLDITAYSGRGILSESAGPVWMVSIFFAHIELLFIFSLTSFFHKIGRAHV